MKWRTIDTDTEGRTGVAPVCENSLHAAFAAESGIDSGDPHGVYDCCPKPHIETYGEADARMLATAFSAAARGEGAEICS